MRWGLIPAWANELISPIHDRKPVILASQDYNLWLEPEIDEPEKLIPLLKPDAAEEIEFHPAGFVVNSPKHDGED